MICQLRRATLSDPSKPERLVPEGANRLLAFRLKGPANGPLEAAAVETHDPTALLEGRAIDHVAQNNGTTAFLTRGKPSDGITLVVSPLQPGRVSGDAYLNRFKRGRPVSFAVGGCGFFPSADATSDFAKLKDLPGTQP